MERSAVLAQAKELLNAVPQMRAQLQASLNKTTIATHNNPRAPRCVPTQTEVREQERAKLDRQLGDYLKRGEYIVRVEI